MNASPQSSNRNILVVEDDETLGRFLQELLQENGYSVRLAKDGEAGLKAYADARPDLVLTDIYMPYVEGIGLINQIRANDQTLPIIAMSGGHPKQGLTYLNVATCLGANASLAKPFSSQMLLNLLDGLLNAK